MDKTALIEYFDEIAPQWDSIVPRDIDKLRCLTTLLCATPGMRILDVGCGTGTLTPYLLEKQPEYLLSIDLSSVMIDIAIHKCSDNRAEFLCGDVMELDRPDEFDCVILYDTFSQFENRGSLIRQIHRLLKKDGRLLICSAFSRHVTNTPYKGSSATAIPLPAAKTLGSNMSQCFEVDTLIDSAFLYAVSGVKKFIL